MQEAAESVAAERLVTDELSSLSPPHQRLKLIFFRTVGETKLINACPTFVGNNKSTNNFILVENIGVEPMTSSMPWKRSSQLS
jgi:hypothetical protein